ncbi:hypothetical protein L0F63_001148 [Massospora cicadina]|nr:hypothetical protein L0F63_001148 [Massospora cicadina]
MQVAVTQACLKVVQQDVGFEQVQKIKLKAEEDGRDLGVCTIQVYSGEDSCCTRENVCITRDKNSELNKQILHVNRDGVTRGYVWHGGPDRVFGQYYERYGYVMSFEC